MFICVFVSCKGNLWNNKAEFKHKGDKRLVPISAPTYVIFYVGTAIYKRGGAQEQNPF